MFNVNAKMSYYNNGPWICSPKTLKPKLYDGI